MGKYDERVDLSVSEAACLEAVRKGLGTNTRIAVGASSDLRTTTRVLEALHRKQLVRRGSDARWGVTVRGQRCSVCVVPDPKPKRGRREKRGIVPGSSTERLLALLDTPRRGADLPAYLGISPQRVREIVVRLLAHGRIRIGDPAHVLHVVARSDDLSILLTQDEERVLSALPDDAVVVPSGVANTTHMPVAQVRDELANLCKLGLIENAGMRRGKVLYRLSSAGDDHFQRRKQARRAKPAQPVVRSDRVLDVLSYLSVRGMARIKDVRDALGIAFPSMNALMQYLKRKGLVKKVADNRNAPYALTNVGRDALAEMTRRAA